MFGSGMGAGSRPAQQGMKRADQQRASSNDRLGERPNGQRNRGKVTVRRVIAGTSSESTVTTYSALARIAI